MSSAPHMRISLDKLVFFGYHGLYAEEKKLGNTYIIDVLIDFTPKQSSINHLEQTIDYVQVYALIQKIMAVQTPLLETIVINIADNQGIFCFPQDVIFLEYILLHFQPLF